MIVAVEEILLSVYKLGGFIFYLKLKKKIPCSVILWRGELLTL